MFADFHTWREGRGYLFPDLMAVLQGSRSLFANLYTTICRWMTELSACLNHQHVPEFQAPITPQAVYA
ncbi:MAG: hypothetical protein EBY16_05470 [Gammaproteobacteria bacterium]|nr:hypothetical protein [Gammaproteobacteria bacterium]